MTLLLKKRIAIVGSGNWGSAIAAHIGEKVLQLKNEYHERILMWCKEEKLEDGSKLTEVINREHENVKYLPNQKLSENIVAVPDLVEAVNDADILIFVLPHQYLKKTCEALKGHVKKESFALTLIKGFYVDEKSKELILVSEIIRKILDISCLCMMGANIANEVAEKVFCEATIGSRNQQHSEIIRQLMDADHFRVRIYPDVEIIEMLGALKNIVAMLVGFSDGLNAGFNTRAAVLRLGFREMISFCRLYHQESSSDLYLESCGIADLVASALGGRNYNGAKKMVETNKSLEEIEKEDLNGQSLQGPATAREVYTVLESKNLLEQFPLIRDAHLICERKIQPNKLLENISKHPEYNRQ